MNHDKFNDTIAALLRAGRVNHVINNLRSKFNAGIQDFPELTTLTIELERISDTYANMRQFLMTGNPDPERGLLYESIKESLRDLGRRYLFIINQNRLDPLFAEFRMQKVRNQSLSSLFHDLEKNEYHIEKALETEADASPFIKKREDLIDRIFRKIWSLPPSAKEDIRLLSQILDRNSFILPEAASRSNGIIETSFIVKSQIISALFLSLLKFNDPAKLQLLLSAYNTVDDERLEARLFTAIVLVLARWGNSAVSTSGIRDALQALEDSILTYTRLRDVVMTLIRTRDTDRVSREVNEAFSSTMKEITPEMLEKLQKDGMAVDVSETGMNPEWEKLMKNKDIEEKMQAINDMQLEGMDVMMQTFSRLKNFTFFRSVSNWFLPFSIDHSEVSTLFNNFSKEGFNTMADATEMCSGDRYSFVLGILQMPASRREMLAANVGATLDMMKDQIRDRNNVRRRSIFAAEALSFARDLYRFSKIYPKRDSFFDPFEKPLNFQDLPVIGSLVNENEILLTAADFYFQHGYYSLALPLYEGAVSAGEAERHIYEKIGYCNQMLSDYHSALESYEKADLFSSDTDKSSNWLLKRLAFCNKALGRYEQAADYYRKLIERNPDDHNLEFHLASVLLRSGEINMAKDLISKVHYFNPDHEMCARIHTRLKAHDAFAAKDYKNALNLYEQARGAQAYADYIHDLREELKILYPTVDITLLSILLDT